MGLLKLKVSVEADILIALMPSTVVGWPEFLNVIFLKGFVKTTLVSS